MTNLQLIDLLHRDHCLEESQWQQLLTNPSPEEMDYAKTLAREITVKNFGKTIYFRGIIEFSNICRCDCRYCGIRCSNKNVARYRLTQEDILRCCQEGYEAVSVPSCSRAARMAGLRMNGCMPLSAPSRKRTPTAP